MKTASTAKTSQRSVILTDDHAIVRHAVKSIIESDKRYQVIAEADSFAKTIELMGQHQPDLLVLDLGLPDRSGIEVLRECAFQRCHTKVVILSMFEDERKVLEAIAAGADAYILKSCSSQELLEVLNQTDSGTKVVPLGYEHLLEQLEGNGQFHDPLAELSKREKEVFYLLAEGLPNRIIAKRLFISARTVETHRARAIKKLGLSSTADLIRFAIKNELLAI